jgi:hypothetical protein
MSTLVMALLLVAQGPEAQVRNTLSNDRPQFPIGFAKDRQLLEDANLAAIKEPLRVGPMMEQAAKQGALLAIPSGTKAKLLSTHKFRGPLFKEIVQVEITQGDQKGLRGWVCSKSLVTELEFAAFGAAGDAKKVDKSPYQPLFRDPIAGEKAYLAPQPTMFGMVRTLIRVAVADDSAWAVFQEWQGASESARDAVIKRLETKKAIFFTTVNTAVKVQKVFPDKLVNGIYPVQVEFMSGQFKGSVGWAPVTVVSPVPGKTAKPAAGHADQDKAEDQKTIARRNQRKQQRSKLAAKVESELEAKAQKEREFQLRNQQVQGHLQLQVLQQQAAIAESQAANQRAFAYQQMNQSFQQQQLWNTYRNGGGQVLDSGN